MTAPAVPEGSPVAAPIGGAGAAPGGGPVALVTGAAQGIGAAVARALARAGYRVAALDRHAGRLAAVVAELTWGGAAAWAHGVDVADRAAVESTVDAVERRVGPIAALVNVAGILRAGPVTSYRDEDWLGTFAVNTTGVFYVSRAVGARMAARGAGAIVTVGSNAAGVARTDLAAYAASKAAASTFTRCLGLELAGRGVRCNVVAPGSTDTPMQRALWGDAGGHAAVAGDPDRFRVGIPLARMARPADVADAVLFLLSDRARHITMQELYVDGGASLRL
ncbi:2,3-dihydro-2,3-dihydroxybenzoate dehydrogenase [Actinomycetes bacterium KLBMP 9797]